MALPTASTQLDAFARPHGPEMPPPPPMDTIREDPTPLAASTAAATPAVPAGSATASSSKPRPDRDSAARTLQRMVRGYLVRRKGGKGLGALVDVVRRRFGAWCDIFDSYAVGKKALDEAGLSRAIQEVHPHVSKAQVNAFFTAFIDNAEGSGVDLKTFCSMLEAISIGDEAAAEFADMSTDDYTALAKR